MWIITVSFLSSTSMWIYINRRETAWSSSTPLNDGGIIIVDDFALSVCPGATRAVEEALSDKPEQMISLPDGGGFLIKGRATAQRASL